MTEPHVCDSDLWLHGISGITCGIFLTLWLTDNVSYWQALLIIIIVAFLEGFFKSAERSIRRRRMKKVS